MNKSGALSYSLSNVNPRYLSFFFLKEFDHPDFREKKDFIDKGLKSALKLINYSKYQLADFKDNFLKGNAKADFISRKAGEMHQVIDQIEDLEARIRRESFPVIQGLLNSKLIQKGRERLVKGSHDLTLLAETCAVHVLESLSEFDFRKSAKDYLSFVEEKAEEKIAEVLPTQGKRKTNINPLEIYRKKYPGLSRGKLALIDNALYQSIKSKSLLSLIPLDENRRDYRKEPIEMYNELYEGVTRGSLYRKDRKLYDALKYHDQLLNVPTQKRNFNGDPYSYYLENYPKKTRGEIRKLDSALHRALSQCKQLHKVPREKRDFKCNPISYYQEHYSGYTRGKLKGVDSPLYYSLKRYNQLHLVPTRKELQTN
jgi:hypothetical protein